MVLACLMAVAGAVSAWGLGKASNTDVDLQIRTGSAKAGTTKNPKANSVNLTLNGATKNGLGQPGTSKALTLTLPKGWAWNAKQWPASKRCDLDKVNKEQVKTVCPAGSKIGTGKSLAAGGADETQDSERKTKPETCGKDTAGNFLPPPCPNGIKETIAVTAYVIENGNLGFFLEGTPVKLQPKMIEGKLSGRKLTVVIPKTIQEVAMVPTGITRLNTNFNGKIKVKGKTVGITSNSGGCVKGKWVFGGGNVMRDGTVNDTDTVKCTK